MIHQINKSKLSITKDDAPVLTYCYGDPESPPYFHPLYAPDGQVVTEGDYTQGQYPPGICFTLGTVNGEQLDPNTLTRERDPSSGEEFGRLHDRHDVERTGTAAHRNLYHGGTSAANRSPSTGHHDLAVRTYDFT